MASPTKDEGVEGQQGSGGGGVELLGRFEGDAVDQAEGTLASDGGLGLVADDIEGHLTETFAMEEVGQGNGLGGVAEEAVLGDALSEVIEMDGTGAQFECRAHMDDGTPGQ